MPGAWALPVAGRRMGDRGANRPQSQRGIAAIEFALTVTLLLVIVFGIISFGALFWAQQKLSQLAGDGARYALVLSMDGAAAGTVAPAVCRHISALAEDYVLLSKSPLDTPSGCSVSEPPGAEGSEGVATGIQYATVELSYPVENIPMAGIVGTLADLLPATGTDSAWLPETLKASAKIRLATG